MMRKALGGTIVGNTMEWYDVGVFGYLITTMGPVFLPEADKTVQNLFLLGTFAATFIARPLGGVFFGWLGDKIGRQRVLSMTLIIMAASTFVVGLLPGYSILGVWAAVLLVVTKLVQGFSTGGEYAGATTFVSEHAPDSRRAILIAGPLGLVAIYFRMKIEESPHSRPALTPRPQEKRGRQRQRVRWRSLRPIGRAFCWP